jgi:hypothetical protein
MISEASCPTEMDPLGTTRSMEEATLSLKTLRTLETCLKWPEDTRSRSQRENDSMKTQEALLLSKDKNNKKNNLLKRI